MQVLQGNYLCSYHKQSKLSFFPLIQNLRTRGRNRSCLRVLVPVGEGGDGEMLKEGEDGANSVYTCM
jgi:hypothetical protein